MVPRSEDTSPATMATSGASSLKRRASSSTTRGSCSTWRSLVYATRIPDHSSLAADRPSPCVAVAVGVVEEQFLGGRQYWLEWIRKDAQGPQIGCLRRQRARKLCR